jgi:excisionase family DNA binding protein
VNRRGPLDLPPVLLTPEQGAAWCQVSRSTFDEWTRRPGFPVIRERHLVLIHADELDKWLRAQSLATNAQPEPTPFAAMAQLSTAKQRR